MRALFHKSAEALRSFAPFRPKARSNQVSAVGFAQSFCREFEDSVVMTR